MFFDVLEFAEWLACTNFRMVGCVIRLKHIFLKVGAEERAFLKT
jgi:hypothetical protein